MYKLKILIITILFFFPSCFVFSNQNFDNIIKERKAKFSETKSHMRTINKNLSSENFDQIIFSSKKINAWANKMNDFFPKGSEASTLNKSEASNDIWSNPDGFKKAVENFEEASIKLIKIASQNNIDDTVSAFRKLAGTCKSCHQKFRN